MPRLVNGLEQIFTNLGIVGAGYKLFFFDTTTVTPKTTYSNSGLSVANPNPVECDEAGRPEFDIWGADPATYKMVLGTPDSVIGNINPIVTIDPIDDLNTDSIINLNPLPAAYWGTTTGTSAAYLLDALVPITSYSYKYCFFVDFHIANAAAPTLDVNDIGVINLKKYSGQGTKVALLAGDLQAQRYLVIIDGVDAVVLNPRTPINYLGTAQTITIASGVATLPNSSNHYLIAGEGATADTFDTLNGGVDGQEIIMQIASGSAPITFSLSGNFLTQTAETLIVGSTTTQIRAFYRSSDSKWVIESNSRPLLYAPASQTITYNGQIILAHGLGKAPDVLDTSLVNISTEGGYTAGQIYVYNLGPTDAAFVRGISVLIDATNITIRFGDSIDLITAAGTGLFAVTAAKWSFRIRACLIT